MKLFISANLIINFCVIIGAIIWAPESKIYIVSYGYQLIWFVSVLSFVGGIIGGLYHTNPSFRNIGYSTTGYNTTGYNTTGLYIMIVYTTIITGAWIICTPIIIDICKDCVYIKNNFNNYYIDTTFTCNGVIITTTFTILSMLLWITISYIVYKYAYKKFSRVIPNSNQDNINLESVQHETQHETQNENEPENEPEPENETQNETQEHSRDNINQEKGNRNFKISTGYDISDNKNSSNMTSFNMKRCESPSSSSEVTTPITPATLNSPLTPNTIINMDTIV